MPTLVLDLGRSSMCHYLSMVEEYENMRTIKTFLSKQKYLYLSFAERKVAEYYYNVDERRYCVWLNYLFPSIFGDNYWCPVPAPYHKSWW